MQLQDPNIEARECLSRADIDAAPIPERERALMRFVETITKHAYKVTDEDVQQLRDHEWSDPQIAEAVYIAALFAFFNRVADAFGLEDPNYFAANPDWWPKPQGEGEPAP